MNESEWGEEFEDVMPSPEYDAFPLRKAWRSRERKSEFNFTCTLALQGMTPIRGGRHSLVKTYHPWHRPGEPYRATPFIRT